MALNRRSGFTLIEFITWFGLATITITALLSFETFARMTTFESSARILAIQQVERLIRHMEKDASRAVKFQITANPGIIFEIPSVGDDGEVIKDVNDLIVYSQNFEGSGAIVRSVIPGNGSAAEKRSDFHARNMSKITFSEIPDNSLSFPVIRVSLELGIPVNKTSRLMRNYDFAIPVENFKKGDSK